MLNKRTWLVGILSAALLCPATSMGAVSGTVEAGAAGVAISDDAKRVNEYSVIRPDQGVDAYGKADIHGAENGIAVGVNAEYFGSQDQAYDVDVDVKRMIRGEFSFEKFWHWLDHDQLNYLDAAVPPPPGPGPYEPGVLNPNYVPPFWDNTNNVGASAGGPGIQQIGRAGLYGEDFAPNKDFFISYREYENDVDVVLPFLPNLTFHAGYRLQERQGMEQSIGMSKCTSCHITGESRQVDEETQDLTAGVTGKFGFLTIDYSYLTRDFEEQANPPERRWDPVLSPSPTVPYSPTNGTFDNRLLYDFEMGSLPYDVTPDSEKDTHVLKAKLDLPMNTSVLGSYVNTQVESKKIEDPSFELNKGTLETTYDIYGMRASTRLTENLRLTFQARFEEIENDEVEITFIPLQTTDTSLGGTPENPVAERHSVITRDVLTLGADGVYRLGRYTSLKLGYEYQETERENEHYGTTEAHTIDAGVRTRLMKNLTARANYTYKNIDNPFKHEDAALYIDPDTGLPYTEYANGFTIKSGPTYGTDYYDLRQADLSNLPENVHEGKASGTWTISPNMAATVSYRIKFEDNELERSEWEQFTHSPSLSLWYAPNQKLNLTFAYNYLGQSTEAKFCQGWYDG